MKIENTINLMVMVEADCVAMFPSMRKGNTSKIVGELILDSKIAFDDFCWKEAARYVCLTCKPAEIQEAGLSSLMPKRRFRKGPRPGLNSKDVHSKEIGADSQWQFPNFPDDQPPKDLRRRLIAKVLEVGVRTSFDEHIFTFGGKIFHQSEGGP